MLSPADRMSCSKAGTAGWRAPDGFARRARLRLAIGIGVNGFLASGLVAGLPSPAQARDAIVYRYVPPADIWNAKKSENIREIAQSDYTAFEYRKPRGTPGSGNYVVEDRFEDGTFVQIMTEKGESLFNEESQAWSTQSTRTEDRYYVMELSSRHDDGKVQATDEFRPQPNSAFDFYYWLVIVKDGSARRFACVFDNARMTAPRDRKVMRATNGNLGWTALAAIARFLSEHDTEMEDCEPDTPK